VTTHELGAGRNRGQFLQQLLQVFFVDTLVWGSFPSFFFARGLSLVELGWVAIAMDEILPLTSLDEF